MTREETIKRINGLLAERYDIHEYPSLLSQTERFLVERPFAGKALLDCTPLFANTLLKHAALLAGGADLTVGVSENIPCDPEITSFLETIGVPVLRNAEKPPRPFDVILDCDGSRADLRPLSGVCELTRSGIYHYQDFPLPVVLVDDSEIKEIETSVGTGDGFMRGMEKFGHTEWAERKVVIFGCGKVGRGVAYRCARAGASVTVVDRTDGDIPFARAHANAIVDCRDRNAIRAAVEHADFVVTATGVRGALRGSGLGTVLREHADIIVAAIGIEDEWLDELDRERIVNRGEAVNFALEEPTRLRYIDPTMALSNQSAVDLLRGVFTGSGIRPPNETSERICLEPVLACGLISEEIRELVGDQPTTSSSLG